MILSGIFSGIAGFARRILPLSDEQPTLLEELWEYINGKYFSVDLGMYQHISVGSSALVNLRGVVLGICGGIVVASGMMAYEKNKKGGFVRRIIKQGCLSPETAMTLAELGYQKSFAIKADLFRRTALSKVVKCVERQAHEADCAAMREAYIEKNGDDKGFVEPHFVMDFSTAHFYIPDEEHYAADIRYDNKGSGWRSFVLVTVVAVILAMLVCFLLPEMLQLVDNMVGLLKGSEGR